MSTMMALPPHRSGGNSPASPDLAAEARVRSNEFQSLRHLTPGFTDKLKRADIFRMMVPRDVDGLDWSLIEWLEALLELAGTDASTGVVAAHANICAAPIYACAAPSFRDGVIADADACMPWSNRPRIEVVELRGGIRITGSWWLASGCTLATFAVEMVILAGAAIRRPRIVAVLARIEEAVIEGIWDCVGIAGTASHEVTFGNALVPCHRTFAWPAGHSCCAEILRAKYSMRGAGAVRRSRVLQRLLCEAGCLTHHVSVNEASCVLTSPMQCGIDPSSSRV